MSQQIDLVPTMTPIRVADKRLLRRLAKIQDRSQVSVLGRALRAMAEAEGIDVEDSELAVAGSAPAGEAGAR